MANKPEPQAETEQRIGLFRGRDLFRMLDKQATRADAFQLIGLSCLRDLNIHHDAILAGKQGDGIHAMRITIRRFRTALSIFKDMLRQDEQTPQIKSQLKWLVSQLAPARDIHVFETESVEPVAEQQPGEFEALKTALAERREHAVSQARKAVESKKCHDLKIQISEWLLGGEWLREANDLQSKRLAWPVVDFAQDILGKRIKKVVGQSRHIDKLDAAHRHGLRITIKKLRYGMEFFDGVFPKRTRAARERTLKALTRLQTSLGKLNDIAVDKLADGVLRLPKNGETTSAYAAGIVTGVKQAKVKPLMKKAMRAASDLRLHRHDITAS